MFGFDQGCCEKICENVNRGNTLSSAAFLHVIGWLWSDMEVAVEMSHILLAVFQRAGPYVSPWGQITS